MTEDGWLSRLNKMSYQNNNTHRIVLTGGPGGGKTTAADLIRREIGEGIIVVPEAATMLFMGGFPRHSDKNISKATQKAIFHVQRSIEDIQHCLFPGRVLLCDRGTIDGAVYWPDPNSCFFQEMGTRLEQEFERYDAVIFFESAAVGNKSIEGGNPIRIEDNQKAIELDRRLKEIWSQHPHFIHIPHEESFFAKLTRAVHAFQEVLKALNGQRQ